MTAATSAGPLGWPGHLLTWIYAGGGAAGYSWLRGHEAVRNARQRREDAAAWVAEKAYFHHVAHTIGLGGWHLQSRTPTELGYEWLVVTGPGGATATSTAGQARTIAEKLCHILGLPYGRIDVSTTDFPGQLRIGVRTTDVSVLGAAYHPATTPWPLPEPSPFASWFPPAASIRDPIPWGFCPEDGSPLTIKPYTSTGGRCIGVFGMTGSGKSNLLNGIREHVTRCPDARLVQLNGAHMGDELTWEPLSALTVCGPVVSDERVRNDLAEALQGLCLLVTERSATLSESGHSTFQPTEEDPAVVIILDEVDEINKHVPGAQAALEFLASKQRKSAVALILATQRGVIASIGGGAVRANMAEALVGNVNRAGEARHVTGAETEIPDIRDYSKGEPGFFQNFNHQTGQITGRGRAFLLGKVPDELAYIKRLVTARSGWRDWSVPDMPHLDLDGGERITQERSAGTTQEITGMRARLAALQEGAPAPGAPESGNGEHRQERPGEHHGEHRAPAVKLPLIVPPAVGSALVRLLDNPAGVSSRQAADVLGTSKSVAHRYLAAMHDAGTIEIVGGGRSSRFRLARPDAKPAYVTLAMLADAVLDGAVECADDARGILSQVRAIRDGHPHLTVVPDLPAASGGDGQ
jgi:hypothetical protein